MKNVVFDTSIAIKWFFPERDQDKALDLKNQHLAGKISLCTRDLFLYEMTSSFKNYTQSKIEEKDFFLAVQAIQSLKLQIFPLEYDELPELFAFSKTLAFSIYDCSYLLLAKKLQAPLYTADKKLHLVAKKFITSFLV